MKKLLALIMALIMVMSLGVGVLAADTYTLTIDQDSANHTYEIYQIFVGTYSEDDKETAETDDDEKVLSTITWGSGVTAEGKAAMGDAAAKAETLLTVADAEAFGKLLENEGWLNTAAAITITSADDYTVEDLEGGYYLIKDMDGSLTGEEGYTANILEVVGDTTVTPKDGETTFKKEVDDKNDSNATQDGIEWMDSADHDFGDEIDFKLETTIADNYVDYEKYYLALHDLEEQGLTYVPGSVEVYVDGVKLENTAGKTYYTVDESPEAHDPEGNLTEWDQCSFEVIFEDLKQVPGVAGGSLITVCYKSRLNESAYLGSKGNVNQAFAEFSNKHDDSQRGKSPVDAAIVFTYTVKVNKVDSELQPLSGATFTLEKFETSETGTIIYPADSGIKGEWIALETVETTPDTEFTFEGLDDGEYRLTETNPPEHYNAIVDPLYFTVKAEHDEEWTTQPRLEVLNSLTGDQVSGTIDLEFVTDLEEGELSTRIVNNKGPVLPETGGIGTTLFYIIGSALVLAAIVLMVTKKRVRTEK